MTLYKAMKKVKELESLRAKVAELEAQLAATKEQGEPVAWLITRFDSLGHSEHDVTLSPLTDDTYLAEGDYADPLFLHPSPSVAEGEPYFELEIIDRDDGPSKANFIIVKPIDLKSGRYPLFLRSIPPGYRLVPENAMKLLQEIVDLAEIGDADQD
jgi:hypothetical protein